MEVLLASPFFRSPLTGTIPTINPLNPHEFHVLCSWLSDLPVPGSYRAKGDSWGAGNNREHSPNQWVPVTWYLIIWEASTKVPPPHPGTQPKCWLTPWAQLGTMGNRWSVGAHMSFWALVTCRELHAYQGVDGTSPRTLHKIAGRGLEGINSTLTAELTCLETVTLWSPQDGHN